MRCSVSCESLLLIMFHLGSQGAHFSSFFLQNDLPFDWPRFYLWVVLRDVSLSPECFTVLSRICGGATFLTICPVLVLALRYVVAAILPPLLPTVFTVSVGVSDDRLAKKRITCTNSESILVAGKVTRAFFDKTGTLTKQGLNFLAARSRNSWDAVSGGISDEMVLGMACCHSLTPSQQTGLLVGNPVDRVMFDASGGAIDSTRQSTVLYITDANGRNVMVVKHFDFDHHRMTQSVIVRASDGALTAFVKGSGENVKKVCTANTLPPDFDDVVRESAKAGIYQISMASKPIPAGTDLTTITRDDVESGLTFVGVINFKNVIREETASVIRQLDDGGVVSTMVTGDSVLTGINIAKEAGIIGLGKTVLIGSLENGSPVYRDESDEITELPAYLDIQSSGAVLAVSGALWDYYINSDISQAKRLMEFIRVYGRCTPFDKVSVVSTFVGAGYITLMAGDGGNVSFIDFKSAGGW